MAEPTVESLVPWVPGRGQSYEAAVEAEVRRLRRLGDALFSALTWCWNGECNHEAVQEQTKQALHDWKVEVLRGNA